MIRGATWRSSRRETMRETTSAESARRVRGRTTAKSSPPSRPATSRRRSVSRRTVPIWRKRLVAVGVAEQLVDAAHPVDVEDDHRRRVARRLDGALGELVEVAPVRQLGQRVDVDQVAQLPLRGDQVGDAALVVHDQRELGHEERDRGHRQHRAERGVGGADDRAEEGDRDRQPRHLDQRAGDQAEAQRLERRAGGEVLEARDGGGDVEREAERRRGIDLRRGRDVDRREPGADGRERGDDERDPVGPLGHAGRAARVEAADPGERDDRPLECEEGRDRRSRTRRDRPAPGRSGRW